MSLLPRAERHADVANVAHGFSGPLRAPAFDSASRSSARGYAHLAAQAGRVLVAVIEHAAALIVLAELLILLSGVISRYVFARPLTWTDDVASLLFVWLSMLGGVVALARNQHLRLTIVENWLPAKYNLTRHLVTQLLSLLFLASLFYYSFAHFADATGAINPILGISDAWSAAGLTVGLGLMALFCACQIIAEGAQGGWMRIGVAAILAAACGAVFYLASWATGGDYDLAVFFIGLGGFCIFLGMPIAFAFGLCALAFLQWTSPVPLSIVVGRFESGLSHLILLSIPMFIVLGLFFAATGMARTLITFLATLVGHMRGGMSYVLLGAMYLISGISGAKAADMAAVAPALVPEMRRRGIPDGELVSLLAASSAMSETIPPSLVLITVGAVTGVSIGALFSGGLLPALVLALLICAMARFRSGSGVALAAKATWRQAGQALLAAIPGLILPVVIRTAVVEGIATATEVATIGVLYTVLAGMLLYRWTDWRRMYDILKETASLSGAIMMIFAAANAVSWALTQTGFSQDLATRITAMPGGAASFLAISIIVFVVFGSLLEGIPAIVVFGPMLFPIARSLGVHEVQYAMVAILAMGIGLYMPPFGIGYYQACAISRVDASAGMLRIWPYLAVLGLGVIVIAAVPAISTMFVP
jgi:tripartite ATP-independent transporter DctM subunit